MKKILLFLIMICAFASMNTVKAQGGTGACDLAIANVVITNTTPQPVGTDCAVNTNYTFNATFDIITNSGFKFLFFHSWRDVDYGAGSFNCNQNGANQNIPNATTLGTSLNPEAGKSFMDFGFVNLNTATISTNPLAPTNVTSYIATTYPDNSAGIVPMNNAGVVAFVYQTGNTLHFSVSNITVTVPYCPFNVETDIWGSNSNSGIPSPQCFICGRNQTINNPSIALTYNCQNLENVNKYNVAINNGPAQTLHFTYKVFLDLNDNNTADTTNGDLLLLTSGAMTLAPNTGTSSGETSLPYPYCCIGPWGYLGVYVKVYIDEYTNALVTPVVNTACATLPVKLRSFDANRNKSNVDLKWVTEIETNNKGFYVERKLSNGGWEQVTFVASQAQNGNSNSPLTYVLTDLNNTKGISQYRLRQMDIDGKQAYSMIRSVRGEGQKSNTIIYPNPSGDGKVSIVFEGTNSMRDVSLMDVSGKTLRQWKGVTNNNIQIDNLNSGFYTVRIVNVETGEQVVEKFIVNKR